MEENEVTRRKLPASQENISLEQYLIQVRTKGESRCVWVLVFRCRTYNAYLITRCCSRRCYLEITSEGAAVQIGGRDDAIVLYLYRITYIKRGTTQIVAIAISLAYKHVSSSAILNETESCVFSRL